MQTPQVIGVDKIHCGGLIKALFANAKSSKGAKVLLTSPASCVPIAPGSR